MPTNTSIRYLTSLAPTAIPSPIMVASKDEPPAETKGKGSPVMGRSPKFIPIFTNT